MALKIFICASIVVTVLFILIAIEVMTEFFISDHQSIGIAFLAGYLSGRVFDIVFKD